MNKERLSKLQKWILVKLLKSDDKCCNRTSLRVWYHYEVKQVSINCLDASLTRSIINLYDKKLIDVGGGKSGLNVAIRDVFSAKPFLPCRYIKLVCLSDKGKAKAKKLLNVKK